MKKTRKITSPEEKGDGVIAILNAGTERRHKGLAILRREFGVRP